MKITTKKGDGGETGLFDGSRVSKDSPVMNALGDLDELQSFLGMCRHVEGVSVPLVERIQDDLYRVMGIISCEGKCPTSIEVVTNEDVKFLEKAMEKYEGKVPNEFLRPGSSEGNARFNVARAVCRRAERSVVSLKEVSPEILKYLNRLSDLLFLMALDF